VKFDVVGFGALNVDKLYKVNRIAKAEEESEILEFRQSPGGSAANTAVGLARLGVKTGYVGKVAQGRDGEFLLDAFRQESVDTNGITVSECGRCGTIIGFVDQEGQRALYLDPGVNNSISSKDFRLDYFAGAKFLHLSSFLAAGPFEAQKNVANALPDVAVTLDPGIFYASKGLKQLSPLVKRCFAVFPSEGELQLLTGENAEEGAKVLLNEGVKVVAVKLGKRGCYVTDGKERHLIPAYEVKVVDSTGAGDAFCAGFIYGLLKKKSLRECGTLGNFVASRAITQLGARNGLPRKQDLPF
jgi:ribokinase